MNTVYKGLVEKDAFGEKMNMYFNFPLRLHPLPPAPSLTGANSCCSTTCTVWEIEKTMVNRNNVSTAEECKNLCLGSCDFYWSNPNRSICGFYYALNPNVKPCMCSCNATAGETCSVSEHGSASWPHHT